MLIVSEKGIFSFIMPLVCIGEKGVMNLLWVGMFFARSDMGLLNVVHETRIRNPIKTLATLFIGDYL